MGFLTGITKSVLSIVTNKTWLTYFIVLVLIIFLNFLLPRLLPGGPLAYIEGSEDGAFITEEQKEAMLSYYQLNEPFHEQLWTYVKGIFTFDFGMSFSHKAPVDQLMTSYLSNTLLLVGTATVLSLIISLILGLLSGWWYKRKGERWLLMGMLGLSALPEFLVGLVLLLVFAVHIPLFPMSGATTPFLQEASTFQVIIDRLHHAFLPIVTLTLVNLSSLYLLVRNSTIQILETPYIEFAKMKGISIRRLLTKHVANNAILPIYTQMTIRIGSTLVGAVFVETVFSYPGVGNLLQEAIISRDYPLMHGLFLLFTVLTIGLNALADLTYSKLDPRLKKGGDVH